AVAYSSLPPSVRHYIEGLRLDPSAFHGKAIPAAVAFPAMLDRARLWLANVLLDLAETVLPKDLRRERERLRRLR
ncbi:MAG: hypothetical protein MUO37_06035, partial [Methyloceanibacter sp.]|nr:hypothetical protein [Methyloceanibacter sp.]